MLISQALNDKINEQIGYEFAASIQYTAIASHFDAESLPFWRSTFTNRQTRRMNTPRSSLNFY
jgi:ferritin